MLESVALKPIDQGNPDSFRKKWMWVVTWWLYNDAGLFGTPAEINVVVLLDGRVMPLERDLEVRPSVLLGSEEKAKAEP